MKSTTLKTLFFGLFLVATFALKAQETGNAKYEYAIIKLSGSYPVYNLATITEQESVYDKVGKESYNTLLKKVNEYAQQGWVVYTNTETVAGNVTTTAYFLKRKKQ